MAKHFNSALSHSLGNLTTWKQEEFGIIGASMAAALALSPAARSCAGGRAGSPRPTMTAWSASACS
jgi:hypothetical protein